MTAFITQAHLQITPAVIRAEHYPQHGRAVVYLSATTAVHIENAAEGHALAAAFTQAAQMREGAERAERAAKNLMPPNEAQS